MKSKDYLNSLAYPINGQPPRTGYVFPFDPADTYYPDDPTGLYEKKQKIVAALEAFRRRVSGLPLTGKAKDIESTIEVYTDTDSTFAFAQMAYIQQEITRNGKDCRLIQSKKNGEGRMSISADGWTLQCQICKKKAT
jgi:hypothetical protein